VREIIKFSEKTPGLLTLWVRQDLRDNPIFGLVPFGFNIEIDDEGYLMGRIEGDREEITYDYDYFRSVGFSETHRRS